MKSQWRGGRPGVLRTLFPLLAVGGLEGGEKEGRLSCTFVLASRPGHLRFVLPSEDDRLRATSSLKAWKEMSSQEGGVQDVEGRRAVDRDGITLASWRRCSIVVDHGEWRPQIWDLELSRGAGSVF